MRKYVCMGLVVALVGCQNAKQPGRSNEQVVTIKDGASLNIDQSVRSSLLALPAIPAEGYSTNALAQLKQLIALQGEPYTTGENGRTYGDVLSLNLMAESRDEAQSQTATSIPSTSVPLNVAWGAGAIGGSGGGGTTLDTAYTAFKKWWSSGGSNSTTSATTTPTATAGSACADGSCSDSK